MPKSCVAVGCSNHNMMLKKLSFIRFPDRNKQPERWSRWVGAVKRQNHNKSKWKPKGIHVYLCSEHFVTGKKNSDPFHIDYVPSIFPYKPASKQQRIHPGDRSAQRILTASCENNETIAATDNTLPVPNVTETVNLIDYDSSSDVPPSTPPPGTPIAASTPLTGLSKRVEDQERIMFHEEIDTLRAEKTMLEATLDSRRKAYFLVDFSLQTLEGDDKNCRYFTGLSWSILQTVCSFLVPFIKSTRGNLPVENQLLMVLVRLRQNLQFELLAFQTGLALSTVTTTFWKWIELLHQKLGFMVRWPDREEIRRTNPPVFREHFPRLTGIMHCFEIFMERPRKLKARAEVYSNYKKHSTVKFFIVSNPLGAVTFLSRAWGGRASDIEIVRDSGFIDSRLHHPGDQLLADRGFTLQEDFATVCSAELFVPAFTRGKNQLSPQEVETTRQIAQVRIHIERIIGLMKNRYTILNGPISVNLVQARVDENSLPRTKKLSNIDKIVRVCAALVNLSPGIVYKN